MSNPRGCSNAFRELSYEGEFDAVCNLWSSVGYFSDADNERTLCNLARAVKPGGYLLLDVLASENLARRFLPRTWGWSGEADDRVRICEERHWNFATARVDTTWTFFRNGSQDVRHSSIRLYTCHELVSLLTRYGLTNFACLGNDGEPFSVDSRRLWLEAQKPAELGSEAAAIPSEG